MPSCSSAWTVLLAPAGGPPIAEVVRCINTLDTHYQLVQVAVSSCPRTSYRLPSGQVYCPWPSYLLLRQEPE